MIHILEEEEIEDVVNLLVRANHIVILTGAGISSESGIPTFRGADGYWTKGSKNYHPMDLATNSAFRKDPEIVWEWYHYRRKVYKEAIPNPGHYAISKLEKLISKLPNKQFHLVTQNVDGLHLRVGSSPELTYQVHGNLNYMRCSKECTTEVYTIPEDISLPKCPKCKTIARPHVLWFDEIYNEVFYKFNSSQELAGVLDLLFIIGTTLQTNLPYQIVTRCLLRNIPVIEINPEPVGLGAYGVKIFKEKSSKILPKIIDLFEKRL